MSLARLVITAVTVEGRSKTSVARDYGITRFWVQTLVKRFAVEGEGAFEPHSRRPHTNPRAVDLEVEDQIVRLRKTLSKKGLDAGAETIAAHLATTGVAPVPAVSTIWRILSRRGFVVAQPQKRPRSSWKTFCADQRPSLFTIRNPIVGLPRPAKITKSPTTCGVTMFWS